MSHREVSLLLRVVDVAAVVACLAVAVAVIPGMEARDVVPAGSAVAFALGVVPLIVVAVVAWRLFGAIGRGEVFVASNAHLLRTMGYAAATDAAVWVAVLVAYLVVAGQPLFSVVASLSVALIFAVSLAVVSAALSLLTTNAADIKSENDLVV